MASVCSISAPSDRPPEHPGRRAASRCSLMRALRLHSSRRWWTLSVVGCSPTADSARSPQLSFDASNYRICILVLPETQNTPSQFYERTIGLPITLDVACQLRPPVVGVGLRPSSMHGTAVPEAAVDEDRHSLPGEDDVCTGPQRRSQSEVDTVAPTARMQALPHCQLWARVTSAIRSHGVAGSNRTRPGHDCRLPRIAECQRFELVFEAPSGGPTAAALGPDSR